MSTPKQDLSDRWIQHQREKTKTTQTWACIYCPNRRIFAAEEDLWAHATTDHAQELETRNEDIEIFRKEYANQSAQKRPTKENRRPKSGESKREGPPQQIKRALDEAPGRPPQPPTRSTLGGIAALDISTPRPSEDVAMQDISDNGQAAEGDRPPKRAATGDGISAGSQSPLRNSSPSSSPRYSKPRPTSGQFESSSEADNFQRKMLDISGRPQTGKGRLWQEGQAGLTKSSFQDPSNIASIAAQKARAQQHNPKVRKPFQPPPASLQSQRTQVPLNIPPPSTQTGQALDSYEIVLQPETRPISQEQLVAEVKGIYAGLVMVEAKCIEVDNKQATLAQADPGAQPKLNNEQWQALIALHRTLLHEHHDFFLASQHPSASPALRRLASKYAMPARMWRHGIHSFLELLRHRLPASLDHMLAFIYLAYSMMALLYETVPAFEDTWIECLGDLGRYRMAIEDDDIRDREVWTGVARHWYSKASDKAPTTGRLYHHLAILARPNALQQLFYYAKSLCVVIPFTSARESILTLFDPVLNIDNHQSQYRLPPLDTSFVKAHGLLFTNKYPERFEPTVKEFLSLLDNQIGRVTRKFMEQGYHIAVANCVALLGFASKDNVLMRAMASPDVDMQGSPSDHSPQSLSSFNNAQRLTNDTLKIVLQRIGDPNVLPFIHVTLVFMQYVSRFQGAMGLIQAEFPWDLLATMLNTLLASCGSISRIEDKSFLRPEKDDVRPFPEDFAVRGLLFTEGYFPEGWFANGQFDEEEKYHELPSMTAERKERILWIGVTRIANRGHGLDFDGKRFTAPGTGLQIAPPERSLTYASATTSGETWSPSAEDIDSDAEEDMPLTTWPPVRNQVPKNLTINLQRKSATSKGQRPTSGENSTSPVVQLATVQEKKYQRRSPGGFVWSGKLWKQQNTWWPFSIHAKRISLRLEEAPEQERYKVSVFRHSSLSFLILFPPGTPSRHGRSEIIRLWMLNAPFKNISIYMEWLLPSNTKLAGSEGVDQEFYILILPFLSKLLSIYNSYKVTLSLHLLHQLQSNCSRAIPFKRGLQTVASRFSLAELIRWKQGTRQIPPIASRNA